MWGDPTFHSSFRICSQNFKIRKNGKVSIFSSGTYVGGKKYYVPNWKVHRAAEGVGEVAILWPRTRPYSTTFRFSWVLKYLFPGSCGICPFWRHARLRNAHRPLLHRCFTCTSNQMDIACRSVEPLSPFAGTIMADFSLAFVLMFIHSNSPLFHVFYLISSLWSHLKGSCGN